MSARPTFVYVANAESGDITVLALDGASGALREVERSALGGSVMPLAASPDGRFLHASVRTEPWSVASFAIDPVEGRLRPIGRAPLAASMCWISTDRSGRFLLAASYGGSCVSVNPIGADGRVQGPLQVLPTPANAHSVQVDPANRHVLATCLGGGVVRLMRFDAATGRLSDNAPSAWPARAGSGPRHFVFDRQAAFVYLLGELDGSIEVLAYDAGSGQLRSVQTASALPPGFADAKGAWGADLHLTPDGRFLYASERRSSTLASFAVDAASGRLAPLGCVATETEPRGFAITPDGRFLFAVGQASHRLSRYAIDAQSGRLDKLGDQAVGQGPNWVEIVETGV